MRLFVGLALSQSVRDRLSGLCRGLAGAHWVSPENLHMTLRFIGEVDGAAAADIDVALGAISVPAFEMSLGGLGYFTSGRRLKALWVGADGGAALNRLQAKVESAVVRAGQPPEGRKFKAHVTLARFGRGSKAKVGPFLEADNDFATAAFPIDAFTLFESRLGRGGAHYSRLAEYPLPPATRPEEERR